MSVREVIRGELACLGGVGVRPFDVHAHTGVDVDGTRRSCAEHLHDLGAVGGRSAIFPLCVSDGYADENRRVIEECRRDPERLVPFARLDPRAKAPAAEAAAALGGGAVGFKLHPRAERFRLDHPGVEAILAVAAEARAPVLIHAGLGVGSYGGTITDLAGHHPGCPIVLAHAAISDLTWLWEEVPSHPNLLFDTAWWNPADLLVLFSLVPPGRILFGSDAPYMDLEAVLAVVLRCARFAGLPQEAIDLVLGGQLETILAGEAPLEGGPAPGPPRAGPSLTAGRVVTALTAAGGAHIGDGDPSQMLELARLAVGDPATTDLGFPLEELLEEAEAGTPDSPWALALALAFLVTPGVESTVSVA